MRWPFIVGCFILPCLLLGWNLPGWNPYLVLTLAFAGSTCAYPTGVMATIGLGSLAESLGMTAIGSAIGPLLFAFAGVRWARDQFFWHNVGLRAAGFLAATLIYFLAAFCLAHGGVPRAGYWLPTAVVHALLGMSAAGLLNRCLRFGHRPWRRRRLSLGA